VCVTLPSYFFFVGSVRVGTPNVCLVDIFQCPTCFSGIGANVGEFFSFLNNILNSTTFVAEKLENSTANKNVVEFNTFCEFAKIRNVFGKTGTGITFSSLFHPSVLSVYPTRLFFFYQKIFTSSKPVL